MSAPSPPPDNSLQVKQLEISAAEKERQRQAAEAAANRQRLAQMRSGAVEGGRGRARSYFAERGLDPTEYTTTIEDVINQIAAGIGPDDETPGTYFNNVGERAYSTAETSARSRAQRAVDALFGPDFETRRVASELDDPTLTAVDTEQRSVADQIVQNMLRRGVITQTGFDAARGDLDRQGAGVRAKLNEIGTGEIESGRSALRQIAGRARQTAATSQLGQPFDPNTYGTEADKGFMDWLSGLGDRIRSKAGSGLYKTGGLAAIAGAGQGAQNTRFDPNALAGIASDDEEEQNNRQDAF